MVDATQYAHVHSSYLDKIVLVVGPKNKGDEGGKIVAGPFPLLKLGPTEYIKVSNPITTCADGTVSKRFPQKFGQFEYRTGAKYTHPFPLFPEEIASEVQTARIVRENDGLIIEYNREVTNIAYVGKREIIKGPTLYLFPPKTWIL